MNTARIREISWEGSAPNFFWKLTYWNFFTKMIQIFMCNSEYFWWNETVKLRRYHSKSRIQPYAGMFCWARTQSVAWWWRLGGGRDLSQLPPSEVAPWDCFAEPDPAHWRGGGGIFSLMGPYVWHGRGGELIFLYVHIVSEIRRY